MKLRKRWLIPAAVLVALAAIGGHRAWHGWHVTTPEYKVARLREERRRVMGPQREPGLAERWLIKLGLVQPLAPARTPREITDDLIALGHEAGPAMLAAALDERDDPVRHTLILTIRAIGPKPEMAPALVDILKHHNDPHSRGLAANVLEKMPDPSPEVIDALAEALKHEYVYLRNAAVIALRHHGSRSLPAVGAIVALLDDENGAARIEAARALGSINPAVGRAKGTPVLIEALRTDPAPAWMDKRWREFAAMTLIEIDPESAGRHALPVLLAELKKLKPPPESGGSVPWRTNWSSSYVVPVTKPSAGSIRQVEAIGSMGPLAREAIPVLEEALKIEDERFHQAVVEALKKIRGETTSTTAPAE